MNHTSTTDNTVRIYPPYPGYLIKIGSTGPNVRLIQTYLNAIKRGIYPTLNRLNTDGIFGPATQTTVMQYQMLRRLKVDGIVGPDTWNAIVLDYNNLPDPATDEYPGYPLRPGSNGPDVYTMQQKLNMIARLYTAINTQNTDGIYGNNMTKAVRIFQKQFNLNPDGIIGENTWYGIISVYDRLNNNPVKVSTRALSSVLTLGSTGDEVRMLQSYLNRVLEENITVDGIFGQQTLALVNDFQAFNNLTVDGKVGPKTWNLLIQLFNASL